MKVTDKYVFFWGGVLSNWWRTENPIMWGNLSFPTSEHLFMFLKARCFGDRETASLILSAPDPKEAKSLGRKVRGFTNAVWEDHRVECMMAALNAKYLSSKRFQKELLRPDFEGKHFVEASPYDKIWAIGMRETDFGVEDESNWKGLNLLGKCMDNLKEKVG